MSAICATCPVLRRCARYAVRGNSGRGVEGGYYAGQWLPWTSTSESRDIKLIRKQARRILKAIAGLRGDYDA